MRVILDPLATATALKRQAWTARSQNFIGLGNAFSITDIQTENSNAVTERSECNNVAMRLKNCRTEFLRQQAAHRANGPTMGM